nr:hypothetical protein XPJYXGBL_XPJYXGBL_CDS_0003 [Microvirus sp.]
MIAGSGSRSICTIAGSISSNRSNNMFHSSILISDGFLSLCIDICGFNLSLSRENRSQKVSDSTGSRCIRITFSTGRGHARGRSATSSRCTVTIHSRQHRIKTSGHKIFNLTLMSSIRHKLLPITILSSFIRIKRHSFSILFLLPFTLNRSLFGRPCIICLSNTFHLRNLLSTSI